MANESQREAIKLIGDWCKWLVAVQTAAVGFVATQLRPDSKTCEVAAVAPMPKYLFLAGLVIFIGAIIIAGAIQSALPSAISDIAEDGKIYNRSIYFLNAPFGKLWIAIELQFGLFLAGITLLALDVFVLMK